MSKPELRKGQGGSKRKRILTEEYNSKKSLNLRSISLVEVIPSGDCIATCTL